MNEVQATPARWRAVARRCRPTLRYWMETEVHVCGFAIAASVLLSFFPFLIVMSNVCYWVLGYRATIDTLALVLNDYFGDNFVWRNLPIIYGRPQLGILSIVLLLFTANGIFEPLEVALNRAWGIRENRSYLKNQLVSLGLIFACGGLAMLSTVIAGLNSRFVSDSSPIARWIEIGLYKACAVPISMLILFLIYWLLPNAKIDWRSVILPAVLVGLAIELFKNINLLTYPLWLHKLGAEYGVFKYSVMIMLWSFLGSMMLLAGAEWAARRAAAGKGRDPVAAGAE